MERQNDGDQSKNLKGENGQYRARDEETQLENPWAK